MPETHSGHSSTILFKTSVGLGEAGVVSSRSRRIRSSYDLGDGLEVSSVVKVSGKDTPLTPVGNLQITKK